MAQREAAESHDGTVDGAVEALEGMNWETGEMAEREPIVVDEPLDEEAPLEEVTSETDEDESEVEEDVEEQELEASEQDIPAIDAPVSWSDEQKEVFAELPPDAQSVIVARESERDKGFQQKATELADERKLMAEERQQINYERQQYAQTLSDNIGQGLKEPDIDLLVSDPARYRDEKIAYDQMVQLNANAKGQADHYATENAKQEQADKQEFFTKRNAELLEKLPAFMKDVQTRTNVLDYGKENGYTDGELEMARTADILIIDKAMKWDALQKSKPAAKDKLKVIPKVVKPGAKRPGNPKTRSAKANLKAHHKNGNVHSAAKAMEGMFD